MTDAGVANLQVQFVLGVCTAAYNTLNLQFAVQYCYELKQFTL